MWNLVQDDLLNFPGRAGLDSLFGLQNQLYGPSWLVGSAFGIETGLLSLVPLGICFGGVWLWTHKRKSNRHAKDIRLHEKDDRI